MSLLIRGGTLLTMNGQDSFQGDLQATNGVITGVSAYPTRIEAAIGDTVFEANGLYITPGLIDIFVNAHEEETEYVIRQGIASGISTMLIWNESSRCTLFSHGERRLSPFLRIEVTHCTDVMLDLQLLDAAAHELCPVIDVTSDTICRRTLLSVARTGIKPILFRLSGCGQLKDAIAESGCPVVPAPYGMCGSKPWQLASQFNEMGVMTALTCASPYARMSHLPLCAALCVREGMNRCAALQTITSNPASLLNQTDIGMLASGYRADINIYDGDPLLIATALVASIFGGKIHRSFHPS